MCPGAWGALDTARPQPPQVSRRKAPKLTEIGSVWTPSQPPTFRGEGTLPARARPTTGPEPQALLQAQVPSAGFWGAQFRAWLPRLPLHMASDTTSDMKLGGGGGFYINNQFSSSNGRPSNLVLALPVVVSVPQDYPRRGHLKRLTTRIQGFPQPSLVSNSLGQVTEVQYRACAKAFSEGQAHRQWWVRAVLRPLPVRPVTQPQRPPQGDLGRASADFRPSPSHPTLRLPGA